MPRSLAKWLKVPSGRMPSGTSPPASTPAAVPSDPSPPATTTVVGDPLGRRRGSPARAPIAAHELDVELGSRGGERLGDRRALLGHRVVVHGPGPAVDDDRAPPPPHRTHRPGPSGAVRDSARGRCVRIPHQGRRVRVVVADDHQIWRSGLRSDLGSTFHVVGEAADAEEAIEIIRRPSPTWWSATSTCRTAAASRSPRSAARTPGRDAHGLARPSATCSTRWRPARSATS